jgi:hypothetical protein
VRFFYYKLYMMKLTNIIKSLILAITFASYSFAGITDGKFGSAQIFDVQYNWSGNTLNVSNLIAPFDSNFQHPTVASGDYFQFFNSTTVPGTYGLALYQSDGTLKQVLHDTGSFNALSNNVIFYVGSGFFGTIITPGEGYNYGDSDTFTNVTQNPTANDLTGFTWASLTPLTAGQTAGPSIVSTVITNTVTTASVNGTPTTVVTNATRAVNSTDANGNPVVTTYNDTTTTVTTPVTTTTTTTPVTTVTYSDNTTTVTNGTPVVTTATTNQVVPTTVPTLVSTAVTVPAVTTSTSNGTPTTAITSTLRNVNSVDANGNAVVTTYTDTVTTTITPVATTTTTVPVTTTTLADGTVSTSNGTAVTTTTIANQSTSATTSTLYKTAVTTATTATSTSVGAPVVSTAFTLRPVSSTNAQGNAVVTTYKDTVTTTTIPTATTTTAYPTTTTTFADGTIVVTNDAPVVTTVITDASSSATTSALYSTAVTTQETVTSVERGTGVVGSTFTLRPVNSTNADGNAVVTTFKDTVTTTTVPVATTTTTVAVTTTTYADGSPTTVTRGAPATSTVVTREATTANTSALYSTATTVPKVTTSSVNGTAINTVAVTRGTSTSTPVSVLTSDKTKEKVIEVNRATTTTTTTPVATTTTTTTPVTTITTTTPETTTVYAETNTTVVTYGTPVVTSATSNVVTTNTVNTTESSSAVVNTKFTTRVDQFGSLVEANKRLNLRFKSNPLDRYFNAVARPGIASYINIETGKTNTNDTNVIERQIVTLGGEYFVNYNWLIGLNYNYATLKLDGLNAAGDLKKHSLNLYNLVNVDDWLLEADVGGAINDYTNAHSLPELNLINNGSTKGNDYWVHVRGYTKNAAGLRAFVGGRFEANNTDAFVEDGSALTSASYAANKLTEGTAEGGLRYDTFINDNTRLIGEAGINSNQLITGRVGLLLKNTPDTFSGSIGYIHQRLEDLSDNGARLELNFKF